MSERKIRRGGTNGSIVAAPLARKDDYTSGAATTPPILHAISGSMASALALLLFYPLERARIEMQTAVASGQQQPASTKPSNENDNEEGLLPSSSWSLASSSSPSSSNSSSSPLSNDNNNNNDERDNNEMKIQEAEVQQQQQTILSCLLNLLERGNIYRGAAPVCLTMAISNFVFFYAHNAVKRFLLSSSSSYSLLMNNKNQRQQHRYGSRSSAVVQQEQPSMAISLLASSLAGIVNVLVTNPLWVSNIRIIQGCHSTSNEKDDTTDNRPETATIGTSQSKSSSSYLLLFQEMISIMKQEGLPSLWNGTGASLLLVSNPVIQFFMYEQLKVVRLSGLTASMVPRLTPLEAFFIGALAKAAATVITYPLQLAQVLLRIQTQKQQAGKEEESSSLLSSTRNKNKDTAPTDNKQNNDKKTTVSLYNGTSDCFQQLYANGGFQALYAGMNAKLLQTVLTAATTFLSYEQILRVVRVSYVVLQTKQNRTKSTR